jgi:hypothetical protein
MALGECHQSMLPAQKSAHDIYQDETSWLRWMCCSRMMVVVVDRKT